MNKKIFGSPSNRIDWPDAVVEAIRQVVEMARVRREMEVEFEKTVASLKRIVAAE